MAIDAGVDQLLSYSGVALDQVQALVHGTIFTRRPDDLRHTAIFIGGSDVAEGEQMLQRVVSCFLGPLTVSVMMDANGANTTAAAAVLTARRHLDLTSSTALVLAGTGPVGQRTSRLLAGEGVAVRLASRSQSRANASADAINRVIKTDRVKACTTSDEEALANALDGVNLVISAGAAGVQLLPASALQAAVNLEVAIDLNAVPPVGIEGVNMTDKGIDTGPVKAYGAIAAGRTKMKIHKAAIASLFEANDFVLDAEKIYELGKQVI